MLYFFCFDQDNDTTIPSLCRNKILCFTIIGQNVCVLYSVEIMMASGVVCVCVCAHMLMQTEKRERERERSKLTFL
jgi:hypothetical protein